MIATRYQPPGKPTALGVHCLEARRRPDPGNLAMGGVRERAAPRRKAIAQSFAVTALISV